MIESNTNINKKINTPTAKTKNNYTQKRNLPAGKNKTQSSDKDLKQLECSDNNNSSTSNTEKTITR